jgi:hypothetical protein
MGRRLRFWREFWMGGYCGGTDPLRSGDFLLAPAQVADEGRFRVARFQRMESHERGDGFILLYGVE